MLLSQAEARAGINGDNLSTVCVRWEDNYIEPSNGSISTQTMTQKRSHDLP